MIKGQYEPNVCTQVWAYEWTGNPNDLSNVFEIFDNCSLQQLQGEILLSVELTDMVVTAKPGEVIVVDEDFEEGEAIPYKEFISRFVSVHRV